ncbi:sugar 3,4-ketoisomerase [Cronobacter dublinensis]|uniref:WeoA n=1 Tax=Cronobacter dublinensis subsp. dublinensis LMG 23823 TaxID=1159554 RepID=M9NJR3_9ENTR|nr:FdtA/QdtA family cupin domain-containing protein [Cronobacter dublinensis]AFI81947.1 WeoA [Cronobacter dublinensis subsp. dublinensis LMG 23823]ALB67378.1 dTDP-6-deoxy-3,4-keto-hexulose isomerase [Cronobacter dublinensis subsp. dublinensis LMG 23823]MDI7270560.1 FdtA/QdtA family cupin domain-containing protein [Cronobacter dublinensis]MDI7503127.1 FdtA/QdtA family cupin domain-containing protein [Cronobacter dublinensis]MDT3605701.1 FdtA/QdtA family cupin domain-containing protein [Cronobac
MNIQIIPLQKHGDARGSLIALEEQKNVPFSIKRVYYMFDTQQGVRRGFHAHKQLMQLAVAVRGTCKFLLDDGVSQEVISLDDPSQGLLIEKMVWHEMFDYSDDCVLMVLADDLYDESDYIRDYSLFKKIAADGQFNANNV